MALRKAYPCVSVAKILPEPAGSGQISVMTIFENIIVDRGSRYAVSGAPVADIEQAKAAIKSLCRNKKFAKATHNSWAVLLPDGPVKNDDGEAGAGAVILRMLEREGIEGHLICVTRWFGGKHLGGDRFRHVAEAVRHYLSEEGLTSE